MKSYHIQFIRHGKTEGNNDGKYIGVTDIPLSDEGRQSLVDFREKGMYPDVDAVYSSPLVRCTETAKIIYPENEITVVENLKECNFGSFEGKTAEELKDNELFARWIRGEQGVFPEGGESTQEFIMRSVAAFAAVVEELMRNGTRYSAIIAHGGTIMSVLSVCGLPEKKFVDWMCGSGRGYELLVTPSIWMRGYKLEVISEL